MIGSLMAIMADGLSRESVVEILEERITEYKINPSDENFSQLGMSCSLVTIKQGVEKEGLDTVLSKTENIGKLKKLIDISDG